MQHYLVDRLACPACQGELIWNIAAQSHAQIEQAEARCRTCGATYPVRDGIGLFLTPDLPREDLWAQVDDRLNRFVRQNPETELEWGVLVAG